MHAVNLNVTGDEDDEELFRMIAAAAAAQGIPLQWLLSQVTGGAPYEDDDDEEVEYPFEQLPRSLSDLASFIQSDKCKRILILAGAGSKWDTSFVSSLSDLGDASDVFFRALSL